MGMKAHSMTRITAAILAWLPALLFAAGNTPATLQTATDLKADALAAGSRGEPVIVLYSRADCHYCEEVRRDHLAPLAAASTARGLRVRQVNQDSDATLSDFKGATTRHDHFAAAEKIRLVPVVAFYGPGGASLSPPIVGARLPDFYGSYLERALEEARQKLKARK